MSKGFSRKYPNGRISGDDDGQTPIYIAADKQNNVVVIKFDKPMDWVAMPPEQAMQIIKSLTQKTAELTGDINYIKIGKQS